MFFLIQKWREQNRKRRQQLALCHAIYHGGFEQIRKLVEDGLDLDFVRDGFSPLSVAVSSIDNWRPDGRKIVDYLIEHGASPRNSGNDGLLSIAARVGEHDLIDLALAAGHDIHFCRKQCTTPLQSAAFRNKAETMKYLIEKGSAKEDFDVTRCSWARLNAATITVLLDLGVDVPGEIAGYVKTGKW